MKLTHMIRKPLINKSWSLGHKHVLMKFTIKKLIVNIQLINWLVLRHNLSGENMNRSVFGGMIKKKINSNNRQL